MSKIKNNNSSSESGISKEIKSIGQKSGIYMVGQVLSRAIGFVMIPVYTRYISPTNYGAMELIEILASSLGIIVAINIGESMARFYYGEKEQCVRNKVVSTAYIGFTIVGIPIVLVGLALTPFLGEVVSEKIEYEYILQIAFITTWFSVLCDIGFSYLRMLYKAKLFVIVTLMQLFIALSLNIYLIVFLGLDILGIFYATLISQSLAGIVLALGILRNTKVIFSFEIFKGMIKYGLPLVPSRIAILLGFVSNRFFLRWSNVTDPVHALAQVGLFSLGHKFGLIINRFVTVPFNSYWNPRRMELLLSDDTESRRTVARVCTYATLVTIYAALLLSVGIKSVIEIMASPAYLEAYIVVPFVALAYVALGIETHFSAGIYYSKQTKSLTYIGILGLSVVLIWNYIFVPKYGLIGAATSNLAGFIVRTILIYKVSQRMCWIPYEIGRIGVIFIMSIMLFLLSQLIEHSSPYITFLLRTSIAMLLPFALFLVGFYTKGELEYFASILQRRLSFIR